MCLLDVICIDLMLQRSRLHRVGFTDSLLVDCIPSRCGEKNSYGFGMFFSICLTHRRHHWVQGISTRQARSASVWFPFGGSRLLCGLYNYSLLSTRVLWTIDWGELLQLSAVQVSVSHESNCRFIRNFNFRLTWKCPYLYTFQVERKISFTSCFTLHTYTSTNGNVLTDSSCNNWCSFFIKFISV